MGTNYYFIPKKFERDKIKNLHEEYTHKLDNLLKDYVKTYNEMYKEMSKDTNDLFDNEELEDHNNWDNYMYLAEIEYPKLHICKLSVGWRPLFQVTKFYSNVEELKEFYNKNKDRIDIIDEYGEKQDIEELFKTIAIKSKDINIHMEADEDQQGYEWRTGNFS